MPIRRADLRDAAPLAAFAEAIFRETFAVATTAEDMDLHCRRSYGEAIQAAEIVNSRMATVLCERDGRLVGYAQLRWEPAPACVKGDAPAEIQRLYVHPDWHGKGIAHELMEACLGESRQRGSDVAWLGVWERNPKAIAFYRKFGFVEVGEHVFTVGTDPQCDLVFARPLSAP